MSVSGVSGSSSMQATLVSNLEKNGLSADTATQVGSELDSVIKSAISSGSGKPDRSAIQSAVAKQLADDVQSGKITQDEANTIQSTLSQMQQQHAGGPPPGGPPPGGDTDAAASGSGGSSGASGASGTSSNATVTSVQSTTTGGTTTTVTTYSDGTKTTTTTAATGADNSADSASKTAAQTLQDLLKQAQQNGNGNISQSTLDYASKLLSSAFVDTTA